jgi:hypothetical protein
VTRRNAFLRAVPESTSRVVGAAVIGYGRAMIPNLHRVLSCLFLFALPMIVKAAEVTAAKTLFDFAQMEDTGPWKVEDDVVMGGVSKGRFELLRGKHAVFSGHVSLENNGGFSSVQAEFKPVDVSGFRTAKLLLRGDGKNYRFIVESDPGERVYYMHEFSTGTEWQTVSVPLRSMHPMWRGDRLDRPDYPGHTMSQVRLMVANGRAEDFRLEVGKIWLE